MNEHIRPKRREPTQAAEGWPRWRWTLDEFERFIEMGIFGEDDRVELIGGEIVPMSPKGNFHETMRAFLADHLSRTVPQDFIVLQEFGWRPDGAQYIEPDILIVERSADIVGTTGNDVLLLVEVASSSEEFDLTTKALTYARLGVREYWVVNAKSGLTHVHREPGDGGYATRAEVAADGTLTALLIDGLTLRIADIRR
jgi:Uma2 family endonuclease